MRSLAVLPVAALLGLAAIACTEGDTVVNTPGTTSTGITVSGTGSAFGSPDIAKLQIGVEAEAATVAEARETAAKAAEAVIASVKRNGVADKDVQTRSFNVQPVYEFNRNNGTQTIRAYRVDNILTVIVRKIDTTGKVIDDAVAAGGDNARVQGIDFTIDDPSELQETARKEAVAEAIEKAKQLADAAGVKLGKLVSVAEQQSFVPSPVLALPRTGVGAAETATPIETGELEVTVVVSLLYAIE